MTDFDRYAHSYSDVVAKAVGAAQCGHDFFLRAKADQLIDHLRLIGPPSELTVLDIGCGVGLVEKFIGNQVKRIVGIDMAAATLHVASQTAPTALYVVYDGVNLPFKLQRF